MNQLINIQQTSMDQPIIIPCLGRSMTVGMLYDCRSDTPIPGVTLWDDDTLRNTSIQPFESSEFKVTAEDSIEKKAHLLNIETDLKLSFMGGLIKVEGAAKYLINNRSSTYQARVMLKYSCKSGTKALTMNHLGTGKIEHPYVFDNDVATHVVVAIDYGADVIFVFDRRESSSESCREVEGKLEVSLAKIPAMSMTDVGVAAALTMNEEERNLANSFTCTFHGDIVLKKNPTTFDDAVAVYRELPVLIQESIDENGLYGVPKRAYLYPLSKLDNRAAKLVCSISNNIVYETQSILEHVINISAAANDLENSDICQNFWGVKQQVIEFKSLLSQFQLSFQRILCEMLPKIRSGGMEEIKLLKWLEKIKNSPFDISKLDTWINVKKREFACLRSYLKALDGFPSAFNPGELESFTQDFDLDYVLCFSFGNIISSESAFLDMMKKFLSLKENENIDKIQELEGSWCDDKNLKINIRTKIRQFKDFATANNDQKKIKFVVTDTSSERDKNADFCSVILYDEDGGRTFQLPNSPGKPQMILNAENEITISWISPTLGVESVLRYRILYKPVGTADDSWSHVETENPRLKFTVKQLDSETEYLFKIEAVSEPGKSQAGPESSPLKTKTSVTQDAAIKFKTQGIITGAIKNCEGMNNSENMLDHGPQAVIFIERLVTLSICAPDLSLMTRLMPAEKFHRLRTPGSFRASLHHVSCNMFEVFRTADSSMNKIRTLLKDLPNYFGTTLEVIGQTDDLETNGVVKRTVEELDDASTKCQKAAEEAEKAFKDVLSDIMELYQALSAVETVNEEDIKKVEKDEEESGLKKQICEEKLNDKKKEYIETEESIAVAQREYKRQSEKGYLSVGYVTGSSIMKAENALKNYGDFKDIAEQLKNEIHESDEELYNIKCRLQEIKTRKKKLINMKGTICEANRYLENILEHWEQLSKLFQGIKSTIISYHPKNIQTIIESAKTEASRNSALQKLLNAISYYVQISNCTIVYADISRNYIIPLITKIDKEFAMTQEQAKKVKLEIEGNLERIMDEIKRLIKNKQEEYCTRAEKQMNLYTENFRNTTSGSADRLLKNTQ